MTRKLVVVGDSHTSTFTPFDENIAAIFYAGPITADAFCRVQHELTQQVLKFLSSINPRDVVLIFCMSEIDIRTHYWRDIPILMSRGMALKDFIEHKVSSFVNQTTSICKQLGFSDFVLWGAPSSQLAGAAYDEQFPATGDTITRNILTHLFNKCCLAIVESGHSHFRFSTPFYHMVSNGFDTDPTWLTDTIHITNAMKSFCLGLLGPIVAGNARATAGERIKMLGQADFGLATVPLASSIGDGRSLPYRTWVSDTHQPQIACADPKIGGFTLLKDLQRMDESSKRMELVLRNIHDKNN